MLSFRSYSACNPYTCHTEKQLEAMRIAGVEIAEGSIYELTETFVFRMLKSFAVMTDPELKL